jgi:uncharacterized membrane protein
MIRGALRLAIAGAGIGYALDRILARQDEGAEPTPISSRIVIDAPIGPTWRVLADIERQPLWMHEMKAVRILSDGPVGVGTLCEADVRILGISVTDPVRITEFEPPHRFAISHDGTFRGSGTITLESGADGTTTIVRWDEILIPPVLPHLGALAMTPMLGQIFQTDLVRFKALAEAEAATPATPAKPVARRKAATPKPVAPKAAPPKATPRKAAPRRPPTGPSPAD